MKTKIFCSLFLSVAIVGNATTNEITAVPPLRITPELITQFADEMATNHPMLLAARARTNAAAAGVKSVRT